MDARSDRSRVPTLVAFWAGAYARGRELVAFGQPMETVSAMVAPGVPNMVWGGQTRLMARGRGLVLDNPETLRRTAPLL